MTLTQPQNLQALATANSRRMYRAALKRQLRTKDATDARRCVAAFLRAKDPDLAGMKAIKLIGACPYIGERRAARIMARVGVPEHKLIGDLTERQRLALAAMLDSSRSEAA